MNADKLKKDVGRPLRLRPHVQRVNRYSSMVSLLNPINDQMVLVSTDYDWYVDAVTATPATGHARVRQRPRVPHAEALDAEVPALPRRG